MVRGKVRSLSVRDVRFPTSREQHGSDAMHTDPDYSAAYVILETDADDGLKGHGFTFTLGKGTEVESSRVHQTKLNRVIFYREFGRELLNDAQATPQG